MLPPLLPLHLFISLEENLQLRDDIRDLTVDVDNHKAAVQQLTDYIFQLESQRMQMETDLSASQAAKRVLERDLAKV